MQLEFPPSPLLLTGMSTVSHACREQERAELRAAVFCEPEQGPAPQHRHPAGQQPQQVPAQPPDGHSGLPAATGQAGQEWTGLWLVIKCS